MKKALTILLVLLLVVGEGVWYFVTFRMNETRAAFESEPMDRYSDLKVDVIKQYEKTGKKVTDKLKDLLAKVMMKGQVINVS